MTPEQFTQLIDALHKVAKEVSDLFDLMLVWLLLWAFCTQTVKIKKGD